MAKKVVQVNVRTIPPDELRRWRRVAGKRGLSRWLREAANEKLDRSTIPPTEGDNDVGEKAQEAR